MSDGHKDLDVAEQRIAELEAERQAVIDCVNLYGDETLHWSLDAAGLLKPKAEEDDACSCGERWDDHGYDSYANEPVCPESA